MIAVRPPGTDAAPNLVTLTSARKPLHYESSFAQLGITIAEHRILVVKMGYLVPDLEDRCALNLMALTPGGVYADLVTIPYEKVPPPLYPKDKGMEWAAALARPWARVAQGAKL